MDTLIIAALFVAAGYMLACVLWEVVPGLVEL